MIRWEDFQEQVRRLKAERWADLLNAEPPGRAPGRRPRDPEQERLLTEADRARIQQSELLNQARRLDVDPPPSDPDEGPPP